MGAEEYHPSPSHTPPLSSWSSIARKNSNLIDGQNWRPESSRCTCSLSTRPDFAPAEDHTGIDLARVLFYAHQMDSFQKAHTDFDAVYKLWTPELFGQMLGMISEAGCTKLDGAVRDFHQVIRNNGLWQHWIDEAKDYPRFEALMLDELAHVLENLSPRYLKDVKIDHLLKIFRPFEESAKSSIHGKKRKLKRQITKWIETQPDEVLDENWEAINVLKWRLQCVIDQKDKEQEERSRNKAAYNYNWRIKHNSRTTSPQSFSNKECWPELRKAFESGAGISIGA